MLLNERSDEIENIFIIYIALGKKGDAGKQYKNG